MRYPYQRRSELRTVVENEAGHGHGVVSQVTYYPGVIGTSPESGLKISLSGNFYYK